MRAVTALLAALAACATASGGTPGPAAQLAIATGSGAHRLAVWVKTSASGEICAGSRTGGWTAPPTSFTCLRRGLEPPLLEFEAGGGLGAEATWGVIAGLASPAVTKLDALIRYGAQTTEPVHLRAIPSLPGWHAYTTGVVPHPTSMQVAAYEAGGTLVTQVSGALIHPSTPSGPEIAITPPGRPPSGPAWSGSASNLGAFGGASSSALSIALADPVLKPIIASNGGWLQSSGTWTNCSGRTLGRVLSFEFKTNATFTANLPETGKPTGDASYSETVQTIAAANWPGMMVFVDTTSDGVVGVEPDLDDLSPGTTGVRATPLATVVPAHDTGGPDTPTCWQSGD
jgi:hypothetical protein